MAQKGFLSFLLFLLWVAVVGLSASTSWGQTANCQPPNLLVVLDRSSSMWFTYHGSCTNSDCFTTTSKVCKKVAPDCDYMPFVYQPSPGTKTRYSRECQSKKCRFVRWDIAQNALKEMFYRYGGTAAKNYTDAKARFGLETFSTEAAILSGIVSSPPTLASALTNASVGGQTNFEKAFQKAHSHLLTVVNADTLKKRPTHILFMTDGSPNEGCAPSEAIVKNLSGGTGSYQLKDSSNNIYLVKTFVVGFGKGLSTKAHDCLTKLAIAGKTQRCDPTKPGCIAYYYADDDTVLQAAMAAIVNNASQELCDGLDNDCNGKVDDGNPGGGASCSTGQPGVCATGTQTCVSGTLKCQSTASTQPESCNGKDDDCDGLVDESLSQSCSTICGSGTSVCSAGTWGACNAPTPKPETCDNKDNDCDGKVDEDFSTKGQSCKVGTGECVNSGSLVCASNGLGVVCSASPKSPGSEGGGVNCDGKDNDCDGVVDEGCNCLSGATRACYSGTSGCVPSSGSYNCVQPCRAGSQTCVLGQWGSCINEVTSQPETCDGKDNDCDGKVDEDFSTKGQSCKVGTGECINSGSLVCASNGLGVVCSVSPKSPGSEGGGVNCDGKDNDCDGTIDEGCNCLSGATRACYSGTSGCVKVGSSYSCTTPCRAGSQTCTSGQWGPCNNEVTSQPEKCDGKDNNCDGKVDEAFSTKGQSCSVGVGECKKTGIVVCKVDGSGVACSVTAGTPSAERCDGKDNDCDGTIDEGCNCLTGAIRACYSGSSGCIKIGSSYSCTLPCRAGSQTCDAQGNWGPCNNEVTSQLEKCDGKDNNCDGKVDEAFSTKGKPCSVGVGECKKTGTLVCKVDGSGVACSVTAGTPSPERCDGKDNDCDGSIDEGFPKGQPCSVGLGMCKKTGVSLCKSDGSGVTCSATAGTPSSEVCDGKDNDCDGSIDEGNPGGGSCNTGKPGVCQPGSSSCIAGKLQCRSFVSASQERCDGKDNDCDGKVDEDFLTKGQPCNVGVGACRKAGVNVCKTDGSRLVCSVTAGTPTSEVCDGADNDCDGSIDEGNPGGGGACQTGKPGLCSQGVKRCLNQKLVCIQSNKIQSEVCNGKDDDCDGSVDELLRKSCYSGSTGTAGVGLCKSGIQSCQKGTWGACVGEQTPQTESCDGADNDCDGTTDEGCSCRKGQTQSCGSATGLCQKGTQTCDLQGKWGPCVGEKKPQSEICDGKDNDCDGKVDEDFPTKQQSCSTGKGSCQQSGIFVCKSDGSGVKCSATAGAPQPEVCNGKDDDCDGIVDESLNRACTTTCGAGTQACLAGKWGACNGPAPKSEVCDGKDNNCDGQIDNGLSRACKTACGQGTETCLKGRWQACSAPQPKPEVCDGKDNDCDGTIDENISVRPCKGACGSGLARCEGGKMIGCSHLQPKAEVCDSVDNDCNGVVDDLAPRSCRSVCGEGKEKCVKGVWKDCDAPRPSDETCNGKDDNCDGFVDNKATCPAGQSCREGKCLTPCKETSDCPDARVCLDGFCQLDPCKGVECSADMRCVMGRCVDACALLTCPKNQVCRQGKCLENTCYDLGCPGGSICLQGKCVTDLCLAIECPSDQACRRGRCVKSCAYVSCKQQERCDDGQCITDPCAGKSCPDGQRCAKGECAPDPCKALQCKVGQVCDPSAGACIDDPCRGLRCPAEQRCVSGQCTSSQTEPPPNLQEQPGQETTITQGDAGRGGDPATQTPVGCGCHSQSNTTNLSLLFLLCFLLLARRQRLPSRQPLP